MSPTSSILDFSSTRCEPLKNPEDCGIDNVLLADGTYEAGTLIGEILGVAEVVTLSSTGTVSGGTFTLTFDGQTTTALAYNASATVVAAALNALQAMIDAGGVSATGTIAGDNLDITFNWGGNMSAITADSTSITGGGTIGVSTSAGSGDPIKYGAYATGNSDGTQLPTGILEYPYKVSSGVIYLGDTVGSEWSNPVPYASAWRSGLFETGDLVGLDSGAVTALSARLIMGNLNRGHLLIPG